MRLHYESIGEGSPLIILHGLFGSLENWRSMSRKLCRSFRVFSVDLRNHGGSPHSAEFNYALMAEDLKEFVHEHSLGSTHLLGHSMGGKVAMQFALTNPEYVDRLVVVDIAPRAYPPSHEDIFTLLISIRLERFSGRNDARHEIEKGISDRSVVEFLLKNIMTSPSGTLQWKMNLKGLRDNYHEIIAAPAWEGVYGKPALFIKGEKSDYIRPEDYGIIKKYFSKAELVSVPDAGHWVHAQGPEIFERMVRNFLSCSNES
ncbi:MAG: alpha/beta fold hydrolase [Geobacteraceae bacterium]|nr:alpha/beta fold hydrolase [Geobacteraceae bacterium]